MCIFQTWEFGEIGATNEAVRKTSITSTCLISFSTPAYFPEIKMEVNKNDKRNRRTRTNMECNSK